MLTFYVKGTFSQATAKTSDLEIEPLVSYLMFRYPHNINLTDSGLDALVICQLGWGVPNDCQVNFNYCQV